MPQASTDFRPSQHGFAFANHWPEGMPIFEIPTPLGRIPVGNARLGLCGGMVFSALDYFLDHRPVPIVANRAIFRYIARRQVESLTLPFGAIRYYAWQARRELLTRTRTIEWPRIRASIDSGRPATLGLVQVHSRDPRQTIRNHQVLVYGYEESATVLTLRTYDPNYPEDDELVLSVELQGDSGSVWHSIEGPTIRGFFHTRYRARIPTPAGLPESPEGHLG